MPKSRSILFTLSAILAAAPACNALTGADDLDVGGGGGEGGDSDTPPPPLVEAAGVSIQEIAIYQGIKRPLMTAGEAATSDIPIVAGRDALVRVFYSTDAGYDGQPVTGRIQLGENGRPIDVVQTLSGKSTDGQLESTLNFEIPGSAITEGFQYKVLLGEPPGSPEGSGAGTYPPSGFQQVGGRSAGKTLKVELVPVSYATGGGRILPDTSEAQVALYKAGFAAMYPIPSVEISVHAPIDWNDSISANGSGWGEMLDYITNLRLDEGTPEDVYFYGVFTPKESFGSFCQAGCVAGLGNLGGPGDNYSRAAIGLGYEGQDWVDTALHEIGHTHGRQHSGCDTFDADPGYPKSNGHAGGLDGVWGYNASTRALYPPTTSDVMGYCVPIWISDYTFNAIFERLRSVNNADVVYPRELLDRTYDRVRLDGHGGGTWLRPVTLHTPPIADATEVTVDSGAGPETLVGQYYPYDHLAGGVLLVPAAKLPIVELRVRVPEATADTVVRR